MGLGEADFPAMLLHRSDFLGQSWRWFPGIVHPLAIDIRLKGMDHIDGIGEIRRWEKSGADHVLEISAPENVMRYVIEKGSIAIDGISLTVAGAGEKNFCVWIIPHTLKITALRERKAGDAVNLEADLLGKYADKFLGADQ